MVTSRESGIAGLPIDVPFPVEVVRFGARLHDLGITAFQAAPRGGHTEALLRLSNFGAAAASSDLDLSVDGQLTDVRPLSLAPGQEQTLFWTSLPVTAHQLEAHLARGDDVRSDKTAWAVVASPAVRRVLLVSNGDYFLQTALSVDTTVALSAVRSAAYRTPRPGDYDLIVFDGVLPPSLPPAPVLLIAPPAGSAGSLRFGARTAAGDVTAASGAASPLLHYVDLSDVHVGWARKSRLPDWVRPVVVSGSRTVVAAGDNGSTRLVVFTFNLQESDWPLRLSFPVIVQNVVRFLSPGLNLGTSSLAAGQKLQLFPGPGTSRVEIVRPDGRTDVLGPPFAPYTDTARTGIYSVHAVHPEQTSAGAQFAVNFFPARVAPASGPGDQMFGHDQAGHSVQILSVPVSVAWTLYLAALLLLTVEWWFAFRR